MGYSIAIRVRSRKLRLRFLKFMQENFRRWPAVCGKDSSEWQGSASDPTDNLSYGDTITSIGFNYQSGMWGFERDYIYSVTRWMAIKVGDRKTKMLINEGGVPQEFSEPTPYYIYDGEKPLTPVLVTTEDQAESFPATQHNWIVDEWGLRIGPTADVHRISSCSHGEHDQAIAEETKDLFLSRGDHPPDGIEGEIWWAKRREIYLKYLKPEIDENITRIRQEIQRLGKLWAGEA